MQQKKEYSLADAAAGAVFFSIVALLCFYSAVFMAQDIFPDWKLSKETSIWILVLLTGTTVLYQVGIATVPYRALRLVCRLGVPVLYGAVGFSYAKPRRIDLEDGACALATQFLVKFNRHLKTSFWIWKGKTELIGFAYAFWTLVIVLGLLLLALLLRRRILLLLLPAVVFAAELAIGYIPQWNGMALCFAALLFVQADGESGKQAVLRVPMDKRCRYGQRWYLRFLPAALLVGAVCVLLFCSQRLSESTTGWLMAKAPKIQTFQRGLEQNVKGLWRGNFSPKSETVTNTRPYYTEKEMLLVTASRRPSEDLFLRGFCGTDYQNGSWAYQTQPFSDACAQAGYSEDEAAKELFGRQYRMYVQQADRTVLKYRFGGEFYAVYGGANDKVDYTISHTGLRSTYAFVPYGVSFEEGSSALENGRFVADVQVEKERRQEDFSYSGWNYAADMIEYAQVPTADGKDMFQWYDSFVKEAYLKTPDSMPSVHEYIQSVIEDYVPSVDDYMENVLSGTYDENALKDDSISVVPTWKSRMQSNWTTLLRLQQELTEIDHPAWCNIDRLQIALALSAALQKYQSYSMDLEPLAEGEDPLVCFLMRTRKGYCVHFASAAVLFLRELGVPARYVTGFVVRADDFLSSGGTYTAVVKDSSAHAWVEIYLDQVGWVPVDVTPPAARDAAHAAGSAGAGVQEGDAADDFAADDPSEKTPDSALDDTVPDSEETQADSEETGADDEQAKDAAQKEEAGIFAGLFSSAGGTKDRAYRLWMKYRSAAAALGMGVLLLCCVLVSRRLLHLWRTVPEREIHAGKYRKAVRRVNRRIYRRLCIRRKCTRLSVSDSQYEQLLKAAYPQVFANDWARYMQAVRQAAYSGDEVAAEDARFCFRIYKAVLKRAHM